MNNSIFRIYECLNVCLDENSPAMDWKTRYKIAVGIAKGLHYLHDGCPRRIIHRDIKASNVLLTSDYEPQVQCLIHSIAKKEIEVSRLDTAPCCNLFLHCGSKKF